MRELFYRAVDDLFEMIRRGEDQIDLFCAEVADTNEIGLCEGLHPVVLIRVI